MSTQHDDRYDEFPLLLPFHPAENLDVNGLQSFWYICARAIEESMAESGAVPGRDYSVLDLYKLATPLIEKRLNDASLPALKIEIFSQMTAVSVLKTA